MISRDEAVRIHPDLGLLVDLVNASWRFIHRQDESRIDQIDAYRPWPTGDVDAIRVRSPTDANGLRTLTDESGIVWERTGTLQEVVHGLLELPAPSSRLAPRLVKAQAPQLWTT